MNDDRGRKPNGDLHGKGGDFHEACDDAYSFRDKQTDPTEYVVVETRVTGTNPITGYSVILRHQG